MCDKLVYDLAQEVEGSPSVFIRKDWINILDNQNQNYISNQSVLDTSQLSNSNKWMSYREAYFSVPLTITMGTPTNASSVNMDAPPALIGTSAFLPATDGTSCDSAIGLKNWYGNIIHSFTLDYNGTTIIQQTPFVNMWNSFKLMTSLSYQDILTQGCTIGFYPDDCETWEFIPGLVGNSGTAATSDLMNPPDLQTNGVQTVPTTTLAAYIPGTGVCNNTNVMSLETNLSRYFQSFKSGLGNIGFVERCKWIAFDPQGTAGGSGPNKSPSTYGQLLAGGASALTVLWKNYIFNKVNQVQTSPINQTSAGVIQYAIMATIYLKHVHSFFNMVPLLKGAFMKMTMNLNNCSSTVIVGAGATAGGAGTNIPSVYFQVCSETSSALGGSNMLMLASNEPSRGFSKIVPQAVAGALVPAALGRDAYFDKFNGSKNLLGVTNITSLAATVVSYLKPYRMNLSVGRVCLDAQLANLGNAIVSIAPLSASIYLYIPAYTFNPTFEQAYLSSPVKQIKYTDIYQYQVLGVPPNQQLNNLLTNGIANVKSVLVLPFYSANTGAGVPVPLLGGLQLSANTGFTSGFPVWQSPFDSAGCGTTSPLAHLTNFNIQVSGQNAIYNLQKYTFEQFNNQLYGQNAVNGGLTDGITSGLISRQHFDMNYCYYYVNIERMLPVEQSVPKSIQLIGQNVSSKIMDYICFIEYGTEVNIDSLTGARV